MKNAPVFINKYVSWTILHELRACWHVLRFRRFHSAAVKKSDFRYKNTPRLMRIGGRRMDFCCPSCGNVSRVRYPYPRVWLFGKD